MIAEFDLEILFKVSTHLTLLKSLCGRNMSELGLGVRIYGPDKKKLLTCSSAMTSIIDLETCFKVTAHTLPKGSLGVKCKTDWATGKKTLDKLY